MYIQNKDAKMTDCESRQNDVNNSSPNIVIQNPGEDVKPVVPDKEVKRLVKRLYGLNVTKFSPLNSYDDVNFYIEVDENNYSNPYLRSVDKSYVLKVFNSMDSQRPDLTEAQHAYMEHMNKNGIRVQRPIQNVQGEFWSVESIPTDDADESFSSHWVEIRTFVPGIVIAKVPYTPDLLTKTGAFIGRLRLASQNFMHPFYKGYYSLWSLTYVTKLRHYLFCVTDIENKNLVEDVLDTYDRDVVPKYSQLPMGCVHGDTNEQNILVQKQMNEDTSSVDNQYSISGLLDYTDVSESYLIIDLAICIAYMMIDADENLRLDVGSHLLRGYKNHVTVSRAELDVLPIMVAARLCQSLVLGLHANYVNPENTYVLTTQKAWSVLRTFWDAKDSLFTEWERLVLS